MKVFIDDKHRHDEMEVAALPDLSSNQRRSPGRADSDEEFFFSSQQSTEVEWKRWISEPGPTEKQPILEFWAAKEREYPVMARMARDHLTIPASSAASERAFSAGGNIITKNRNRLAPGTVRYLMCLRSWGVIPEEDYEDDGLADDEISDNED